ncbi:MAG: LPXTG cell wall anchor domain-containing protein [Sporichthyaceae bacterium]
MKIRRNAWAGAALLGAAGLLGVGTATIATAAPYPPSDFCQMQLSYFLGNNETSYSFRVSGCALPNELIAIDAIQSERTGPVQISSTSRLATVRADANGVATGVVQLPKGSACEIRLKATNLTTGRVASARIFVEPCSTFDPAGAFDVEGSVEAASDSLLGARPSLLEPGSEKTVETSDIELLSAQGNSPETGGVNAATATGLGVFLATAAGAVVVSRRRNHGH